MKLAELKIIAESKMAEKHQELQDAIMNEFNLDDTDPMVLKIIDWLHNEDPAGVQDFLYDHYESEMPYSVKTDDPSDWLANHVSKIFAKYL